MVIFTKKVELVSVKQKEVPFFEFKYEKGDTEKQHHLSHFNKEADIEEYRISYWLFGMLIWAYTKIVEVKYVRLFK